MAEKHWQGQFQYIQAQRKPELEKKNVYYTEVSAVHLSKVLDVIRSLPSEPVDLAHVKRIVKLESDTNEPEKKTIPQLRVMLCTTELVESKQFLENLLENIPIEGIYEACVSAYQAPTKQQSEEWAKETWPIMWRGNPQAVLPVLSQERRVQMAEWMERLNACPCSCTASTTTTPTPTTEPDTTEPDTTPTTKTPKAECAERALVVDPKTDRVVADADTLATVLQHAVMRVTRRVADLERERRTAANTSSAYLCTGMHVYLSKEPCAMCAMALVHSRVECVVYREPSPYSGALDPNNTLGYALHGRKQLNHTFQVWRYAP